ncbi:hypothetical protein [Natronorubrum daqingense]|uniref:Rubredoxin n=1 Tax=Natronorubrum daqingense TaxID=588898 RepID=A0A1N7FZX8_9EURY|nr:hypothetical protein [Natronorubrum daqingense]SIS05902.1 hypothetical protein SAMN05421809_3620 [Natronorubrum daqingense]
MSEGGTARREKFSCVECNDFELEKVYSGRSGTPGEEEYDRIQAPDNCPACGGEVERALQSGMEGSDDE